MKSQLSNLDLLPEEILEKILLQVIQARADTGLASRCAVLLTSRKWYRIGLPLFYQTVHIKTERQAGQLATALEDSQVDVTAAENTQIGSLVRALVISCPLSSTTLPRLVSHCTELKDLDICLDAQTFGVRYNPMPPICSSSTASSSPAEALIASLSSLRTISHITLRKENNVYLTLPKVGQFITHLASCVKHWNDLQSVYIAFRLSDDAGVSIGAGSSLAQEAVRSPLSSLTAALSQSPRLESVTTHLPSVWNSVLLGLVGDNEAAEECKSPNLRKIVLLPGAGSPRASLRPLPPRRPSSPEPYIRHPTTAGTSVPGHGLGLSFMSTSPPSISTTEQGPLKDHNAPPPPPLPVNSMYLSTAARHHPKLMNLIRAGWNDVFSSSSMAPAWYGVGRGRASTWAGEQ